MPEMTTEQRAECRKRVALYPCQKCNSFGILLSMNGAWRECPECGDAKSSMSCTDLPNALDTIEALEKRIVEIERELAEAQMRTASIGHVKDALWDCHKVVLGLPCVCGNEQLHSDECYEIRVLADSILNWERRVDTARAGKESSGG